MIKRKRKDHTAQALTALIFLWLMTQTVLGLIDIYYYLSY